MNQFFIFFIFISSFAFAQDEAGISQVDKVQTVNGSRAGKDQVAEGQQIGDIDLQPTSQEDIDQSAPSKITRRNIADLLKFVGFDLRKNGNQGYSEDGSLEQESHIPKEFVENLIKEFKEKIKQLGDSVSQEDIEKLVQEFKGKIERIEDPAFRKYFEQLIKEAVEETGSTEDTKFPENLARSLQRLTEEIVEKMASSEDPVFKEHLKRAEMEDMAPVLMKQISKDYRLLGELHTKKAFVRETGPLHPIRGYPLESLVFYTAVGADMFIQATTDSFFYEGRGDPIWMENFLDQVTTPVGLFSFLCFVFFSGNANYLYSKLLLDGFVFTKGPLKGYQIRALMPFELVDQSLKHLRQDWIARGGWRKASLSPSHLEYKGGRMRMRFLHKVSGSLALSAGMMASNIVHELEYMFGYNPEFKQCQDSVSQNRRDATLACELFWGGKWWQGAWVADISKGETEMGSTLRSWMPDLFSLVSASVVSHAIVQTSYRGAGMVAKGTVISGQFVKGLTIRTVQNVPIEALIKGQGRLMLTPGWYVVNAVKNSVQMALWLAPVGAKIKAAGVAVKGVQTLKNLRSFLTAPVTSVQVGGNAFGLQRSTIVGPASQGMGIWAGIKSMTSRILGLLVFFKTDQWITTPFFNVAKDNMKAREIVNTIETFEKYYNDNPYTPHLICDDQQKSENCQYHPRIASLFKVGNSFNRWRMHKTQEAAMDQMNWVMYVFNAIGYFEYTYRTYKEFFRSKKGGSVFNNIPVLSNFDGGQVLNAMLMMRKDIKLYLENHSLMTEDVKLQDVVSYAPSHFLKPDIEWDRPDSYHLSVLDGLFGAAEDLTSSLELFYTNWSSVFEEEKKRMGKNLDKKDIEEVLKTELKDYFKIGEEIIAVSMEMEDMRNMENGYVLNIVQDFYNEMKSWRDNYFNNEFRKYARILKQEDVFNDLLYDEFSSIEGKEVHPLIEAFAEHFKAIDIELEFISEEILLQSNNEFNEAQHLSDFYEYIAEIWIPLLQSEQERPFLTLLDKYFFDHFVEYISEDSLRKRVISTGLQYLNYLVKIKTKKIRGSLNSSYIGMTRQKEREGLQVPPPALPVFYKLGPNNIFAKLHAKTFVKMDNEFIQIEPHAQGMLEVQVQNILNHQMGHPKSLKRIYTPHITDFIIASALCGPDLDAEENPSLLNQIQWISSQPDSQAAFETLFEGESLDDIVSFLPVFDPKSPDLIHDFFGNGLSYAFYPPRITHLKNESEREAICDGFRNNFKSEFPYHGSVYEGNFQVEGKTYNNMLHLVLDFLEAEGLSSEEEFDRWWKDKVEPYYVLFMMVMDREFENVAKYFIEPVFQTGVKTINAGTDLDGSKFFPKRKERMLDQIVLGGDFAVMGLVNEYVEGFNLDLPHGVFQNLVFELSYLSDTILHFMRINSLDFDEDQLKSDLQAFREEFQPDSACSDENNFFEEMVQNCSNYARNFLKKRKELLQMWLDIAGQLNIDLDTERFSQLKQNIFMMLNLEEREKEEGEVYIVGTEVLNNQLLPQALVEFSMLRFYGILSVAAHHAFLIGNISESPDVKQEDPLIN